ncbi:hypothetical protein PVAP13_7KG349670 [Panicum virgatum]|uniref:Uncharacterized protein n=1 Tax=Panicum virgatum TaxID=38727 RepID=A0A8T0QLM2_PANVG|nr:hypothetical protein PVAP13_7KG349670 [Panicum virgatum]
MGGIISADRGTAERHRHRHLRGAPTRVKATRRHHLAPSSSPLPSPCSLLRLAAWLAAASIHLPAPPRRSTSRRANSPPHHVTAPVRRFLDNQPLAYPHHR